MVPNELIHWYWLRDIKKIGPARIKELIDYFGSPELVFAGGYDDYARVPSIGPELAKALASSKADLPKARVLMEKEALIAERLQVVILPLSDPSYPTLLRKEEAVAPPLLYVRGSLDPLSSQTIAVIGTRHPSPEGTQRTGGFARSVVASGWQVISGLAIGVDAAAHQGALDAGGYTVAVLGCGIDRIYPPENKALFASILDKGGAIISEYPFGTPPKGDNLRRRNRIIVALSQAVVLAECPADSGALIAVQEAFEQVKPVFAFSFPDGRKTAAGSQRLTADGEAGILDPGISAEALGQSIEAFHRTSVSLLFDLDGVLVDVTRLTRNALLYAVKAVDSRRLDKKLVDEQLHLSPRAALKNLSGGDIDLLLRAFNMYWKEKYARDVTSHPHLRPMLEKLGSLGMPMGIVTSRNSFQASSALDALKIKELFQSVTTWGDTMRHKPDPAPIRTTLEALRSDTAAIYVGDRAEDVEAARAAGVVSVGATWFLDAAAKRELEEVHPDHIVEQPSDLFKLVLRLKRQQWTGRIKKKTDQPSL